MDIKGASPAFSLAHVRPVTVARSAAVVENGLDTTSAHDHRTRDPGENIQREQTDKRRPALYNLAMCVSDERETRFAGETTAASPTPKRIFTVDDCSVLACTAHPVVRGRSASQLLRSLVPG